VRGTVNDAGELVAEPAPGPREDELPLRNNVVDHPAG